MIKKESYEKLETYTRETLFCDICKKELGRNNSGNQEVTIEYIEDCYIYPIDGFKRGIAFDFCPDCFKKEILPLLKSKATPREVEYDW